MKRSVMGRCWGCALLGTLLIAGMALGDDLKRRGMMGINLAPLQDEARTRLKLGSDVSGVLITAIVPESAAAAAGLKPEDLLIRINDATVTGPPDLTRTLRKYGAGDTLKLTVLREGKEQAVELILRPRPLEQSSEFDIAYDWAGEPGQRVRTIITKPREAKKTPAILFMQGLGPFSIEIPAQGPHPLRGLIAELTKSGFVVMRAERLGIGDSEGTDVHETTIQQDIASFKAALAKLKTYDFVDQDRVFVFAHSSGAAIAPSVVESSGARGVVTFAAYSQSLKDMMIKQQERVSKLSLDPEAEAKSKAEKQKLFLTELLDHKKAPKNILAAHPELADFMKEAVQNDMFVDGVHYRYLQQLGAVRPLEGWKKVGVPVLVLWGEADFVASKADSEEIAKNVSKGTLVVLPKTDHLFSRAEDQEESFLAGSGGTFNPAVVEAIGQWIKEKVGA